MVESSLRIVLEEKFSYSSIWPPLQQIQVLDCYKTGEVEIKV
jgi:hypothetical protein